VLFEDPACAPRCCGCSKLPSAIRGSSAIRLPSIATSSCESGWRSFTTGHRWTSTQPFDSLATRSAIRPGSGKRRPPSIGRGFGMRSTPTAWNTTAAWLEPHLETGPSKSKSWASPPESSAWRSRRSRAKPPRSSAAPVTERNPEGDLVTSHYTSRNFAGYHQWVLRSSPREAAIPSDQDSLRVHQRWTQSAARSPGRRAAAGLAITRAQSSSSSRIGRRSMWPSSTRNASRLSAAWLR